MFSACGGAGASASPIMDKVRAEMERRNVVPNGIVTNSLISALALCGKHEEAMEVYLDFSKLAMEPDHCTFGGLLLAVGKDKTKGVEMAQQVWKEMKASRLQPDLYTFNIVLQILRDAGLGGLMDQSPKVTDVYEERVISQFSINEISRKVGKVKASQKLSGKQASSDKDITTDSQKSEDEVDQSTVDQQCGTEKELVKKEFKWIKDTPVKKALFVKGRIEFELSDHHVLTLNVGSERQGGPLNIRWLEQNSIEYFYSALKLNSLAPNVHTFHLLAHLTLDPVHLLVTMKERKVAPDEKLMVAVITQQARRLANLQGAKVRQEMDLQPL